MTRKDPRFKVKVKCTAKAPCIQCQTDKEFLCTPEQPRLRPDAPKVSVVDLFCGCGGMTVGLTEAARRADVDLNYSLAVDCDNAAINLYRQNFPDAHARAADVSMLFPGEIGASLTPQERKLSQEVGPVEILVGGPPCQGHSDLNNHTRRSDPKNALYLRMARAAEVLQPSVVVIENVPTVRLDRGGVVEATRAALTSMRYRVSGTILDLRRIGVPQRRKRYVLIASSIDTVDPSRVLETLVDSMPGHRDRTVGWAIHDLLSSERRSLFDTPSQISAANAARIALLFDRNWYDLPNDHRPSCHRDKSHSYVSMYGRLRWSRPAQTITTGFGSMGQGRYVHPQRRRTLTPHEAARLQTFPDWFDFQNAPRGVLATVIGNAVPPLLMAELGKTILPLVAENRMAEQNLRKSA